DSGRLRRRGVFHDGRSLPPVGPMVALLLGRRPLVLLVRAVRPLLLVVLALLLLLLPQLLPDLLRGGGVLPRRLPGGPADSAGPDGRGAGRPTGRGGAARGRRMAGTPADGPVGDRDALARDAPAVQLDHMACPLSDASRHTDAQH